MISACLRKVALQKVGSVPVTTGRDAPIAIFIDLKGALQLCRAQHSGSLTTSEIWEVWVLWISHHVIDLNFLNNYNAYIYIYIISFHIISYHIIYIYIIYIIWIVEINVGWWFTRVGQSLHRQETIIKMYLLAFTSSTGLPAQCG